MSRSPCQPLDEQWIGVPTDDLFRLLAAERRRVALDVLVGWSTPIDLEELAAAVAARETDPDEADVARVESVAVALHHVHLPKMTDLGVLDYDPGSKCISAMHVDPGLLAA